MLNYRWFCKFNSDRRHRALKNINSKFVIRSITKGTDPVRILISVCSISVSSPRLAPISLPRFASSCFAASTEIFPVQAHMFIVRAALCLLICRCLFVLWKHVCLLLRGCDITCLSEKTLPQMAADEWNNWGRMHTLRLLQTDRHDAHTLSSWLIRQQKSQSYSLCVIHCLFFSLPTLAAGGKWAFIGPRWPGLISIKLNKCLK